MPDSSVAAARRTSPGLMPSRWALARSTSIATVGSSICALDARVSDAVDLGEHPLHPRRLRAQDARVLAVDAHDAAAAGRSR